MIDLNSLPIPAGALVAGAVWAGVSVLALGPLVAERTIDRSGWAIFCELNLRTVIIEQMPQRQTSQLRPCEESAGQFGQLGRDFCDLGGDILIDLLTIDPTAGAREAARRAAEERLNRLAEQASSRCSCAASQVAADRVSWGLHSGSARLLGGPDDLQANLMHALQAPHCASIGEGFTVGLADESVLVPQNAGA